MITIQSERRIETQIDRACAAQSSELLPKLAPTKDELEARKKQIEAKINARFAQL